MADMGAAAAAVRFKSNIQGEYVPVAGNEVTQKLCTIPPKDEKLQAVEVVIAHLAPGTKHEMWLGRIISS